MSKSIAAFILVPFTALSAYALHDVGVIGILQHMFVNSAGWQIFVDLVIALIITMFWMFRDAKRTGRNPWPYFALALIAGSFGPLLYVVLGHNKTDTSNGR